LEAVEGEAEVGNSTVADFDYCVGDNHSASKGVMLMVILELGLVVLCVVLMVASISVGSLGWALFFFTVGVLLYDVRFRVGGTLSHQLWELWETYPKLMTALWAILLIALAIIMLHLKGGKLSWLP